jgi:hypothetical protein
MIKDIIWSCSCTDAYINTDNVSDDSSLSQAVNFGIRPGIVNFVNTVKKENQQTWIELLKR